jgi:uncharacterized Zn-finger protein
MDEQAVETPCQEQHYKVHPNELPICCPRPNMRAWNAHPRVYLDLESKSTAKCPYCGVEYSLIEDI